jgi:hypothetical protein
MKVEAEMGVMMLYMLHTIGTPKCQDPLEPGEVWSRPLSLTENQPCWCLILDFQPPELGDKAFCYLSRQLSGPLL